MNDIIKELEEKYGLSDFQIKDCGEVASQAEYQLGVRARRKEITAKIQGETIATAIEIDLKRDTPAMWDREMPAVLEAMKQYVDLKFCQHVMTGVQGFDASDPSMKLLEGRAMRCQKCGLDQDTIGEYKR